MRHLLLAAGLLVTGLLPRSVAAEALDYPVPAELCTRVLTFGDAHMRYCGNRSLYAVDNGVTRAVIVIPGSGSPAQSYYNTVTRLAEQEHLSATTTIIVPQFLEDGAEEGIPITKLALDWSYLYWGESWRFGYKSKNLIRMPSYEVIDRIVRMLMDDSSHLQHVAVVGHSAGAQFTHRYAAGNAVEDFAKQRGVTMSYGASAPGSYLYLTDDRPHPDASCADVNEYPYGLDDLSDNAYMNDSSVATIENRLFNRHIYYFVGDKDTDTFPGCARLAQGHDRQEMMANYEGHLNGVCHDEALRCAISDAIAGRDTAHCFKRCTDAFFMKRFTIAGADHNHKDTFGSSTGRNILFRWR
jgi:pimeloyl-ACP methyl ester carboxylesterase